MYIDCAYPSRRWATKRRLGEENSYFAFPPVFPPVDAPPIGLDASASKGVFASGFSFLTNSGEDFCVPLLLDWGDDSQFKNASTLSEPFASGEPAGILASEVLVAVMKE